MIRRLLGKLMRTGVLSEQSAGRAEALWRGGETPERAIVAADGRAPDKVLPAVAEALGTTFVNLDELVPERDLLDSLPAGLLSTHKLLPLSRNERFLRVATASLFDTAGLDELRVRSGLEPMPVLATDEALERGLRRHIGVGADTVQSLITESNGSALAKPLDAFADEDVDLAAAAQDASIIKFVNQLLTDALERNATDVHIEPFEDRLSVRFRIDGVLVDAVVPPNVRRFQAAIVSRIKILSHLDIAEKRLPQDGRIRLHIGQRDVDVRVSIIPMLYGEAVALRLLDRSNTLTGLEALGMARYDLETFRQVLGLPHGIVLVTGPTGSGKTTTLYAALARINDVERKIITIEDPIEYQLSGINQIQVDTRTGLTFARGLRAVLRHDPDVVLVGEIRDRETAEIAVQASLTGHLVFSTLHTNDAPGAITRLIDMGIEPYLVASSLEMVIAQRLVRLICSLCSERVPEDEVMQMRESFRIDVPDELYRGRGCPACSRTGYRGRQGIFEIMPLSERIRSHATDRAATPVIRRTAVAEGMRSLREDGFRLLTSGRTTVEEVMRVSKDEQMRVEQMQEMECK